MKLGTIDIEKIYVGDNEIDKGMIGSIEIYSGEPEPDYTIPFYVEDVSGSSNTLTIKKASSSAPTLTIEKSSDGVNWTSMGSTSTTGITATVPANGRLYLRCSTTHWSNGSSYYDTVNMSKNYQVGGNSMSLIYGSSFTGNERSLPYSGQWSGNHLSRLFSASTTLQDAQDLLLPSETLDYYCYGYMFYNCTNLKTVPKIMATSSNNQATGAMTYMFYQCKNLVLPPKINISNLGYAICESMFQNCTSLTTTPELKAGTLVGNCYKNMFAGCRSLNNVKCLATDISASDCTTNWLNGVAASGTFITQSSTSWTTGSSGIPSGWNRVNA